MKNTKRQPSLYKASNVTFDANTITGISYGWWHFVRVIDGMTVFNWYAYSNSTAKHQRKVWSLMASLNIPVGRTVRTKKSLSDIHSTAELEQAIEMQRETDKREAEGKRLARNAKARLRRLQKKNESIKPAQQQQPALSVVR